MDGGMRFNCALTNPPFSMTKELANETEANILKQYALAKMEGTSRLRNSLRSNAMFMERYRDLLIEGGRLLTVIDDGLLAGDEAGPPGCDLTRTNPDDRRPVIATLDGRLDASTAHD